MINILHLLHSLHTRTQMTVTISRSNQPNKTKLLTSIQQLYLKWTTKWKILLKNAQKNIRSGFKKTWKGKQSASRTQDELERECKEGMEIEAWMQAVVRIQELKSKNSHPAEKQTQNWKPRWRNLWRNPENSSLSLFQHRIGRRSSTATPQTQRLRRRRRRLRFRFRVQISAWTKPN